MDFAENDAAQIVDGAHRAWEQQQRRGGQHVNVAQRGDVMRAIVHEKQPALYTSAASITP